MFFVKYFGGLAIFIIALYHALISESMALTVAFSAIAVVGGLLSASVVNWRSNV